MESPGKRCGRCDHVLTEMPALVVDGNSEHTFSNSAGVTFQITCYREATGAAPGGPASDEQTWFAGHTWRRLFCRECSNHVGWQFRSRSRVFVALVDRELPA